MLRSPTRRHLKSVIDLKSKVVIRVVKDGRVVVATNSSSHLGAKSVGGSRAGRNVWGNEGTEDRLVDSTGATSGWKLEPKYKGGLEDVVEGEVVKDDAEGKRLEERKETKDTPVGKPVKVLIN